MDTKTRHFSLTDRRKFSQIVNQYLHPREEVEDPRQLKGRDEKLDSLLDCFQTPGANAFIWGYKGVGKTSLAHTACEKFNDEICKVASVACEETTTLNSLMLDIARKIVDDGEVVYKAKSVGSALELWGFKVSGDFTQCPTSLDIQSVNQAVDLLNTLLKTKIFNDRIPVIIIDEFDRLTNEDTKRQISDLIKQLSVGGQTVKLIFCGVADSLLELLGKHGSAERYIHGVELKPLISGALMELIEDVEEEFQIDFSQGQKYRICQISDGFPHFTHLMLKDILMVKYKLGSKEREISQDEFKAGIECSVAQSEIRLKDEYEAAIHIRQQPNEEILWAVAYGPVLSVSNRDIELRHREIINEIDPNKRLTKQQIISYLTGISVTKLSGVERGKILIRKDPGWYEFIDPMVRSYTRLVAESKNIDLGDYNLEL